MGGKNGIGLPTFTKNYGGFGKIIELSGVALNRGEDIQFHQGFTVSLVDMNHDMTAAGL